MISAIDLNERLFKIELGVYLSNKCKLGIISIILFASSCLIETTPFKWRMVSSLAVFASFLLFEIWQTRILQKQVKNHAGDITQLVNAWKNYFSLQKRITVIGFMFIMPTLILINYLFGMSFADMLYDKYTILFSIVYFLILLMYFIKGNRSLPYILKQCLQE